MISADKNRIPYTGPVSRRLVFKHTIEGLFTRAYGAQVTPALKEEFRRLGLEGAAVEAEAFGKAFVLLRDAVHPGIEPNVAERQMGERFLAGYFETAIGGLVKMMLKLLPVEKAVMRVPQSLMSGANFIEARVEKQGERQYRLTMSDFSTSPDFLCGIVSQMITRTGGIPEVKIIEQNGRALVMAVSWK